MMNQEIPIRYLRIEIEILKGEDQWNQMLEQLVHHPRPMIDDSDTRAEEMRLEHETTPA
jgi:hypothetical protein